MLRTQHFNEQPVANGSHLGAFEIFSHLGNPFGCSMGVSVQAQDENANDGEPGQPHQRFTAGKVKHPHADHQRLYKKGGNLRKVKDEADRPWKKLAKVKIDVAQGHLHGALFHEDQIPQHHPQPGMGPLGQQYPGLIADHLHAAAQHHNQKQREPDGNRR